MTYNHPLPNTINTAVEHVDSARQQLSHALTLPAVYAMDPKKKHLLTTARNNLVRMKALLLSLYMEAAQAVDRYEEQQPQLPITALESDNGHQ